MPKLLNKKKWLKLGLLVHYPIYFSVFSIATLSCLQDPETQVEEEEESVDNEAREREYRKKNVEEAVAKSRKKLENAKKQYEEALSSFRVVEDKLNQVLEKQKQLEETIKESEEAKVLAEKEIITLETKIAAKKISYPEIWENKNAAKTEMRVAQKEYENEKNAVSEKLEILTNILETSKETFLLFPREIEKVSKETYVSGFREFLLYVFGLKFFWGMFTGYRATFVYPNQFQIEKTIDKFKTNARKTIAALNQVINFNFAKVLKDEFEKVFVAYSKATALIEKAPAALIELKKQLAEANYIFKRSGQTLPKFDTSPKTPEYLALENAQKQIADYTGILESAALEIVQKVDDLIKKYNANEKAPVKKRNFENYRDLYLNAESAEKNHSEEESRLKQDLAAKKNKVKELEILIKNTTIELQSVKKQVAEIKLKFDSELPKKDTASSEMLQAEKEFKLAKEKQEELAGNS